MQQNPDGHTSSWWHDHKLVWLIGRQTKHHSAVLRWPATLAETMPYFCDGWLNSVTVHTCNNSLQTVTSISEALRAPLKLFSGVS